MGCAHSPGQITVADLGIDADAVVQRLNLPHICRERLIVFTISRLLIYSGSTNTDHPMFNLNEHSCVIF